MRTCSIRRRLALVAAPIAGAVGIVLVTALPAWAHHVTPSGQTTCATNGTHLVTWTIPNTESAAGHDMSITSISAHIGVQTYAVTGYTSPIPPKGSTNATSVVPGNVTGTIELNLSVHWADGFNGSGSASVDLGAQCVGTTTTTSSSSTTIVTAPETSSTIATEGSTVSSTEAPTSTLVGSEGSTASTVVGASVPISASGNPSTGGGATSSSATSPSSLPFTGLNDLGPVIGTASVLLGGGALAFARRKGR